MRRAAVLTVLVVLAAVAPFAGTATAQEQVTLDVTVVDGQGNEVSGATVIATWDGGNNSETTTASGRALVDVERGADVEVTIEDDEYTRNFPFVVEDAQSEAVTVEVAQKGSAVVSITGEGDQPVANATVFIEEPDGQQRIVATGKTNSGGRFSSGTLEQGDYTLALSKPGYYNNETTLSVTGDVLRAYEMRRGTVNVGFIVRDDHFENPRSVNDAAVSIEGIGTQRTTNGRVTFTLPVNTRQSLSVTKENYLNNQRTLDIGEQGRDVRLFIQRTPMLTVDPSSRRVLVGNNVTVEITNAYDEPVRGAEVRYDGTAVGTTDSAGEAEIRIDAPGNHTIVAAVEPGGQETPTPTATPTPTPTPTPTATEEPTPTATTSGSEGTETTAVGLPGFTPAVAVLSLLAAALVLARRRD